MNDDPNIAMLRSQAEAALPFLGLLAASDSRELIPGPIRDAIDRRQPLVPAVARQFRVPEETICFLRGKSLHELGVDVHPEGRLIWAESWSIGVLLTGLAGMAPEHRPRTRFEWSKLYDLVNAFAGGDLLPEWAVRDYFCKAGKQGIEAALDEMIGKYGNTRAIYDSVHLLHQLWDELAKHDCLDHWDEAMLILLRDDGVYGLLNFGKDGMTQLSGQDALERLRKRFGDWVYQ